MRWDELFADLEADAAGLDQRELDLEISERTRIEMRSIRSASRLASGVGRELELRVDVLGVLRGRLERVTPRWLLVAVGAAQWLVAADAVLGVRGLRGRAVSAPPQITDTRLGWGAAWRVLARDRAAVHVVRRDGSTVDAVADRVGEDFVELALATSGPRLHELVPFTAVVGVRCPRD